MFGPLKFDPAAVAAELARLRAKLDAAPATLAAVGDYSFGCTPREEVYSEQGISLQHFRGERKPDGRPPILICYALVNRPYMVDLQPDRSVVRSLLERGEDVYLVDWGYPEPCDRWRTLDDYLNHHLLRAVEAVCERSGVDALNLLGICQGGAFSVCFAAMHPERVRNLVTMVTPVDFHTPDNMLGRWARSLDVDLMVDTLGNIPADLMNWCYLTLKPLRLNVQKYVGMVDLLDDPGQLTDFLRMEKWIFDSPDQAGETFRQFMRDFYQRNLLVEGGLVIGGREVDLGRIRMPVLNVYAEQDHLVPPSASRPLGGLIGSDDYSEIAFRGGHIGIYVSGRAQREVPPAIQRWLAAR